MLSSFSDTFFDIYRLSGIAGKIHSISTLLSGEILEFSPNHGYIHIIQKEKCLLTMDHLEHHLELKHCDIVVVLPGNFHSISLNTDAFQDAKIITCTIDFSGIMAQPLPRGYLLLFMSLLPVKPQILLQNGFQSLFMQFNRNSKRLR